MKQTYLFIYNIMFLMSLSNPLTSYDTQNHQENIYELSPKAYVNPNDLLITENGLFIFGINELIPLDTVGVDEYGFYVEAKRDPEIRPRKEPACINGHPIYHEECGGCANWWCNSRCKCYSPW